MPKRQLRKKAFGYIKGVIGNLHGSYPDIRQLSIIPLNQLVLLKEGLADPSAELVASLKQLLKSPLREAEIENNLVMPFQEYSPNTDD